MLIQSLLSSVFTNIPVYIALPQQNIDYLKSRLGHISDPTDIDYGQYLSRQEIQDCLKPDLKSVNTVKNWINSYRQGDYIIENYRNYGDSLYFTSNNHTLTTMFGVNYQNGYQLPEMINPHISFVEMSSKPIIRKIKRNISSTTDIDDRYFGKESLQRLYHIPEIYINDTVGGIVEYQNNAGFLNSDLTTQQLANGQSAKNITYINGTNQGTDGESELDVQMLSMVGDNIDINYYTSPYWLYSFSVDLFNAEIVPDVVSMSWGWAEDSQCDIIDCSNLTSSQYVERVNNEYLKLALRGVTLLASSGDAGAPGRTNEDCNLDRPLNPIFPSGSPYVLSVGATAVKVLKNNTNWKTELCQNNGCVEGNQTVSVGFNNCGWTAGGGFNLYSNSTPKWQREMVGKYLFSGVSLPHSSLFNVLGRAYPDVSAVGHSCPTYMDGYLNAIDGTSCSSPIMAGLISIINQHQVNLGKPKLGFANPFLYSLFTNCSHCFRDVLDGDNSCTEDTCCENRSFGFKSSRGYDPVTGLGELNIQNILDYLS